ncbi:MAG: biosynthetic-type acetolactate synthase large subunit [Negativicutes bacterium]
MKLSGSRIIIEMLIEQGVDTVFGYPGGAIMPLYDALYDAPLRHVLTVHEQGSAHAADGYARASGRVGVCIATSGPGATNLVTGLATAYMDSSPVVAITGQVGTPLLGRDAFQEIDITGLTMSITKHNFLVRNISDLAETVRSAFSIAREGRPGPVLIDVPRDILLAEIEFFNAGTTVAAQARTSSSTTGPDAMDIEKARAALLVAKRPILLCGGGIIRACASKKAAEFSQVAGIPAVSTLMGLGALPPSHPYYLGLTGMHGHKAANLAVAAADLVVAVGSRFSDRVTGDRLQYVKNKTIIHIDVDAAEMGKNVASSVTIVGDLLQSLSFLIDALQNQAKPDRTEWLKQVQQWQQENVTVPDPTSLNPAWIMNHMSEVTANQSIVWVTDVGQHQMWAAQHLQIQRPGTWLTSGGLGTMGFGLPAALGAQLSCPEQRTILLAGDGGFKMTGLELYTAAIENIPVICIILNNSALGMVRQWQHLFFNRRYSATILPEFDFVGLARTCGVTGASTHTPEEFSAAFRQALQQASPCVIVANIAADCMVDPMVQPGQPVNQFVDFSHLHRN